MEKTDKALEKEAAKKNELLQDTIKQIEKQYGKGSIMKLGDRAAVDVDAISSGSIKIDLALGIGGYPKGRIIEVYGPESSGKTTLALHAIAEVQKKAEELRLLMLKMPLIQYMLKILVLKLMN